jgi:hypothetical protein
VIGGVSLSSVPLTSLASLVTPASECFEAAVLIAYKPQQPQNFAPRDDV